MNFEKLTRYAKNLCLLFIGKPDGVLNIIRALKTARLYKKIQKNNSRQGTSSQWCILTTPHTLFIANQLKEGLKRHGWSVEISFDQLHIYDHDWYVVLCAQMFTKLPPKEKRIIFQLEQSVHKRWFTPHYFKILNNSLSIIDYSIDNIKFLSKKGISFPYVHYLPVGAIRNYYENSVSPKKKIDVLFYGDCLSSPRRKRLLNTLKDKFNIKIISNVFGEKLYQEILSAKVVLNIHYYENALLETTRIYECLSLGVPVISESSQDSNQYKELQGAVRFFTQGNSESMINSIQKILDSPPLQDTISQAVTKSSERFDFMFDRFLMSMNFLHTKEIKQMHQPVFSEKNNIVLSLPEAVERRENFEDQKQDNCVIFDGIRRMPGWIGCGLSYQFLMHCAISRGFKTLTVMEDDVLLPQDFDQKIATVREYLNQRAGQWDLFSGLIAILDPDVKIIDVEHYNGLTFVTIDKVLSAVFNIYTERIMQILIKWDPENTNSKQNTIDKYLASHNDLKVIVTFPFLVQHCDDLNSILWGFKNSRYSELIKNSEQLLLKKILAFKS